MAGSEEAIENAARWMHEWSQLDEGVERPWGDDGCDLCRGRVRILVKTLSGEVTGP